MQLSFIIMIYERDIEKNQINLIGISLTLMRFYSLVFLDNMFSRRERCETFQMKKNDFAT